jgi:hypothetical protein
MARILPHARPVAPAILANDGRAITIRDLAAA